MDNEADPGRSKTASLAQFHPIGGQRGLVNKALDYFAAGDLAGFMTLYSHDPIYRVPGSNRVSGLYRGKQAITDFFMKLGELTGWSLRVTATDVLADDQDAYDAFYR